MAHKKAQKYFHGDKWFQRSIDERTRARLKQLNVQFSKEHASDSNEKLLEYVRDAALRYGHTPNPLELIGGSLIAARFHGWQNVIATIGLKQPRVQPEFKHCELYKTEYKSQARLFRLEHKDAKEQRKKARQEKSIAAHAEQQRRYFRDMDWGKGHETDTDEELLAYIRHCSAELNHTPTECEIIGGTYIRERFGSWGVVLYLAELAFPKGMNPPKQDTLNAYYAARKKCKKPSVSNTVAKSGKK